MSGKSSTQNEQCDVINLQEWSGATATGRTTETRNLARDEIADASSEVRNQDRPSITGGAHVVDADALSATALKEKYPRTYNSWRNMKDRRKKGAIVAPEFEDFRSFLCRVGPRPSKDHTLDRVNNDNPTYGPGLVRWADKRRQANNRSTTIFLTYQDQRRPLTEWADITDQNPGTLRHRRSKGWSDAEVITGKKKGSGRALFPGSADPERQAYWEEWYKETGKLVGQSRSEFWIDKTRYDVELVRKKVVFFEALVKSMDGTGTSPEYEDYDFGSYMHSIDMDMAEARAELATAQAIYAKAQMIAKEAREQIKLERSRISWRPEDWL